MKCIMHYVCSKTDVLRTETSRKLLRKRTEKTHKCESEKQSVSPLRHFSGQGRIINCAGCTMGGGPADQLPNLYHAVLTQCTFKRND